MAKLRRREFLATAGAAAVGTIATWVIGSKGYARGAAGQPQPPVGPQLAVRSAADPSVAAVLDEYYPGFRQSQCFQQIGSSCYLVGNVSGKSIRAFSTNWTVTKDGNTQTKVVLHYFRPRGHRKPRMHFGRTGNKTRFTAKIPILKAGAIKLVSPYFAFTPTFYWKYGTAHWERLLNSPTHSNFPMAPAALATGSGSTSMTIDAVLTHNFYVVGPNKADLGKIVRVTRNAEHDEALSILAMITAGAPADAIRTVLQKHAFGMEFDIKPKNDLYFRVRQRQAKVLLRRLKHARPEQFAKTILYLAKQPKTVPRQG